MKRLAALSGCLCAAVLLGACANSTTAPPASTPTSVSVVASSAEPITTTTQALDLTAFIGKWNKHQETLTVAADGIGDWTYADVRQCPDCSSAEAPAGTLRFTLTSVSNGVASGAVTASSDTQNGAVGDTVTAKIVPGFEGKGVNLVMTIGKSTERVMCNSTSPGQCGA
jgi:hypothetical protein